MAVGRNSQRVARSAPDDKLRLLRLPAGRCRRRVTLR